MWRRVARPLLFPAKQRSDSSSPVHMGAQVVHDQLWPRHIASLLRTAITTQGELAPPAPATAAAAAAATPPQAAPAAGWPGPAGNAVEPAEALSASPSGAPPPPAGAAGSSSGSSFLVERAGHAGARDPVPAQQWGAWCPSWVGEHRLLVGGAVVLGASLLLVAVVGAHRRGHQAAPR